MRILSKKIESRLLRWKSHLEPYFNGVSSYSNMGDKFTFDVEFDNRRYKLELDRKEAELLHKQLSNFLDIKERK